MRISVIAAMSENRVIGQDKKMPWHLPADLRHFKEVTMGKPILMGRTTHESIGTVLPGRCNIVITRDPTYQAPGCVVVYTIEDALFAASYSQEIFVIGGEKLYRTMLPRAHRLYLTLVHQQFEGDTFFPEVNFSDWIEATRVDHQPDDKNPYAYSFLTLNKK